MAVEFERLVAVLEADISRFDKNMAGAQKLFDQRSAQIEKRQAQLQTKLNAGWNMSGFTNFARQFTVALGGTAIIGFIRNQAQAADALLRLSDRTGATTDQIQELFAVSRSYDIMADTMSHDIDLLGRHLGEANSGVGDLAKIMRAESIPTGQDLITTFLKISDAVKNAHTATERYRIVNAAFGRADADLINMMAAGSEVIKARMRAMQGMAIPEKDLKSLAEFDERWKSITASFTRMGAGPAAEVTRGLEQFLNVLERGTWEDGAQLLLRLLTLGRLTEAVPMPMSAFTGQEAEVVKTTRAYQAAIAARDEYISGSSRTTSAGFVPGMSHGEQSPKVVTPLDSAQLERLEQAVATAQSAAVAARAGSVGEGANLPRLGTGGSPPPDPGASRAAKEREEAVARAVEEEAAAQADLVRATDAANLARAQGTAQFYAVSVQAARDEAGAEIADIEAKKDKELKALDIRLLGQKAYDEAKAAIENAAAARIKTTRQNEQRAIDQARAPLTDALRDAQEQIDATERETATIGLYGGALAEAKMRVDLLNAAERLGIPIKAEVAAKIDAMATAYGRATAAQERAQVLEQRSVQLQDATRQGLEDVGVAALHGADSFKQAVGQMLVQLAELFFRLTVLKPLIEAVLGQQGQSGGGVFGDIVASIIGAATGAPSPGPAKLGLKGFASGGTADADEPIIVGERGRELFVPRKAGEIIPHDNTERALAQRRKLEDVRGHYVRALAKGGDLDAGEPAFVGEHGREMFTPRTAGTITPHAAFATIPRLPAIPRAMAPTIQNNVSISMPIDARGAQEGVAEQIAKKVPPMLGAAISHAVKISDDRFAANLTRVHTRGPF